MDTKDTSLPPPDQAPQQSPDPVPPAHHRRWPKRVAIGLAVTAAVVGGVVWYGGRETTLQMLAQRVANASGGKLTLSGVSGSLYGHMHIARVVFRSETSVVTADDIDIDWKPWQYLSRGVEIDKLYARVLQVETIKETDERSTMPTRLAPPFQIAVEDARVGKALFVNATKGAPATTEIDAIRARLHGDKTQWKLDYANAATPWGQAAASGTIANALPYKLDATATLSQARDASAPASPANLGAQLNAQLSVHVGGDLKTTVIDASGQAARAQGKAHLVMAPFAEIPLQSFTLNARNIDPGFFDASLPTADLNLAVAANIDANRDVSGSVDLTNDGPLGTIDQQRLPLKAMRGKLAGNLSALQLTDVLLDLGGAGHFTGNGSVERGADEKGIGTARFALSTDRLDLKQIHGSMKQTAIAGSLRIANTQDTQTLNVDLRDAGMRLVADATLANKLLTLRQAQLSAGGGNVRLTGTASLADKKPFKVNAVASHLNPAAFGDFPKADLNAEINAAGALAPAMQVAADFALRPSRLFDQPLSGRGKLAADMVSAPATGTGTDAKAQGGLRVHDVDASLALGQNTVDLRGGFGAPGDKLAWHVDGRQLSALRGDLYGALVGNGVVTGTMNAPRTTFTVDANGLGWVARERKNSNGVLHASGEAWLGGTPAARVAEVKASGSMQRLNPAAFGSPFAGSINGSFDAAGRSGANMGGSLNLTLQQSTLANSPLSGYARLAADKRHVSDADVDLHLGGNVVAAKGAFGSGRDTLNWRIDAPQLAALGPDYAGALRGAGSVSGSVEALSFNGTLDGSNLKLMGTQSIRAVHATANLGAGHGAADPLALDVQVTDYASGDTRIATARLQSSGTRGAHKISAAARGDAFDASLAVHGGWNTTKQGSVWAGSVDALQNRGRFALSLAAPTPLRIATAPGAGIGGLAKPEQIAFNGATIRLPSGAVTVESLSKVGPHWTTRGSATGVPVSYLTQVSDEVRDNLRGDLTIGAQWALDLRQPGTAGGIPALDGNVHVFREKGDLIAGATVPVVLGLRQLDARVDVANGAVRGQLAIDGSRIGTARVDATAQMIRGRVANDSPLRLTANANLGSLAWVAPLVGQPGLEMDGALAVAVSGAGTVGAPTLSGGINGDGLAVRWPDQGVRLRNGQLRAVLAGDQLQLQRFAFEGNSGRATIDGNLRFAGGEATMNLKLVADKLEALSRPDRRVIVSGQATVVRDATHFNVDGNFRADRALVEFAPQDRPTISEDVIVLGRGTNAPPPKKSTGVPLTIDLTADLGDDFHVRGMGADTYLQGSVHVRKVGDSPPRINGSVSTANGTYAAYGQKLNIERGVVTFSGAYDNPSLDILAVRPLADDTQPSDTNVQAGVQVRGTALAPNAKLVSTPNVSDSDKLSWLVLGHGMQSATGSEADVLSAAAGALLGGKGGTGGFTSKLANKLGVDELGVRRGAGQASGLEGTVVTVGKRISSRLYIAFEQGAATATSVVKVRYKVTPRISLQLQTGTNTALDVLYSWTFD